MEKIIRGRNWRFYDDVDTDQILPGRYLALSKPEDLAVHCMECGGNARFLEEVKPGDLIVAGKNFGCGSSREHAPQSIKSRGIKAIIAESFARIFYRNAFNVGLPVIEANGVSAVKEGDDIELNLESGEIKDLTTGETYQGNAIPPFLFRILSKGGLLSELEERFRVKK